MFNPTEILIEAFGERLEAAYWRTYGHLEPSFAGILAWAGHMALESIANSDALYHDVEHTIMVTLVGQEMLKGKHLREGGGHPKRLAPFYYIVTLSRYRLRSRCLPGRQ